MLKKKNRISQRKEFWQVKKEGKLVHSPLFGQIRLILPDEEKKFGIVISRKISKKAVVRNKIRRILAEELRKSLDQLPKGIRMILLVKPRIVGEKRIIIEKEVEKLTKV